MQKSSSVDGRRAAGLRAAALPFVAATVYLAAVFVAALGGQTIRSGVASYAVVTALCAFGLMRRASWGRTLALLVALGAGGIGVLSVVSVALAGGNMAGAVVMAGAGFATAALVARGDADG